MATITDLGRVKLIPRGEWSSATANYEYLDVVTYLGASYSVRIASGYVPAGTLPTNLAYFQVLAKKGDKGDKGDVGNSEYATPLPNAGTGTEEAPFTSTDGTAGFAAGIATLTRGGKLVVTAKRHDTIAAIPIDKNGLSISGISSGFNEDPNGESEGFSGSKIKPGGTNSVFLFSFGATPRRGAFLIERLYIWGPNPSYKTFLFDVKSGLDQPRFRDINVSNIYAAFRINSNGGLDTAYITNFNILNAGYGYLNDSANGSYFNNFEGGCWADLDYNAALMLTDNCASFKFAGMTIVRCSRKVDPTYFNKISAVDLKGSNHRVFGNIFAENGRDSLASAAQGVPVYTPNCHALVLRCFDSIVNDNAFTGNATGAAVLIFGSRNRIEGNNFSGVQSYFYGGQTTHDYSPTAKAYSNNRFDIYIGRDAFDNVINQSGFFNLVDLGQRTIVNGQSKNEGDPDVIGIWAGVVVKPTGVKILDTTNGILYEYNTLYSGGRRVVATGLTAPVYTVVNVPDSETDLTKRFETGTAWIVDTTNSARGGRQKFLNNVVGAKVTYKNSAAKGYRLYGTTGVNFRGNCYVVTNGIIDETTQVRPNPAGGNSWVWYVFPPLATAIDFTVEIIIKDGIITDNGIEWLL